MHLVCIHNGIELKLFKLIKKVWKIPVLHLASKIALKPIFITLLIDLPFLCGYRRWRVPLLDLIYYDGDTQQDQELMAFFVLRFLVSVGLNTEVCHVDPTGSVDSRGFRPLNRKSGGAKNASKVEESTSESSSPKKQSKPRRKKPEKSAE